jgi:hypothetical protein
MTELVRVLVRCEKCRRVELFVGTDRAKAEESLARSEWVKSKEWLCPMCKQPKEWK